MDLYKGQVVTVQLKYTVLTCVLYLLLIAKDLIKSMLCVDTTRRFTARKILADPWFTVSFPCHGQS